MKKLLFALCAVLLIVACTKTFEEDIVAEESYLKAEQLQKLFTQHDIELSVEEIQRALDASPDSRSECYDQADLNSFLGEFGQNALKIIPSVPNDWFQDANCTVAKWTANVNTWDPVDSTANNTSLIPTSIEWVLDSIDYITVENSLILPFYTYTLDSLDNIVVNENCPGIFQPSCNGYHNVTVTMTFDDGSVYSRYGTAYGQVNNVPDDLPTCNPDSVNYTVIDLGTYDFVEQQSLTFEPYQFLVQSGLEWDLNNDGYVNVSDLLILLVGYGAC